MSRTIDYEGGLPGAISPPSSGQVHFVQFQRPASGSGNVVVGLSKSDPSDLKVKLSLVQDGREISSTIVEPTTSTANYSLPLSEQQIANLALPSTCDVIDLELVITPIPFVPSDCCPSGYPTSLNAHISAPGCSFDGLVVALAMENPPDTQWVADLELGDCGPVRMVYEIAPNPRCFDMFHISAQMSFCFTQVHEELAPCPFVTPIGFGGPWTCGCGCPPDSGIGVTITL